MASSHARERLMITKYHDSKSRFWSNVARFLKTTLHLSSQLCQVLVKIVRTDQFDPTCSMLDVLATYTETNKRTAFVKSLTQCNVIFLYFNTFNNLHLEVVAQSHLSFFAWHDLATSNKSQDGKTPHKSCRFHEFPICHCQRTPMSHPEAWWEKDVPRWR